MSERQTKAGNLANLIARSLDHLITLSISHSMTLDMLNNLSMLKCRCLWVKMSIVFFTSLSPVTKPIIELVPS